YPAANFPGALFYETDRKLFYLSQIVSSFGAVSTAGVAVTWVAGSFFLPEFAGQAITINGVNYTVATVTGPTSLVLATSAGTQFGVTYSQSGVTAWTPVAGEFEVTQASLPGDLGTADQGLIVRVTDYNHKLEWFGIGWGWAYGDDQSGR